MVKCCTAYFSCSRCAFGCATVVHYWRVGLCGALLLCGLWCILVALGCGIVVWYGGILQCAEQQVLWWTRYGQATDATGTDSDCWMDRTGHIAQGSNCFSTLCIFNWRRLKFYFSQLWVFKCVTAGWTGLVILLKAQTIFWQKTKSEKSLCLLNWNLPNRILTDITSTPKVSWEA